MPEFQKEKNKVINLNMEHNLLPGFTIVAVSIVGTVVLYEKLYIS